MDQSRPTTIVEAQNVVIVESVSNFDLFAVIVDNQSLTELLESMRLKIKVPSQLKNSSN